MTERGPMPSPIFAPAPCPQCGAVDMDQANDLCRPSTDETGERYCGGEFNDDGVSVQPTAESLAAIDLWCDAEERRIGGEQTREP